jgi:hypothetical protein
MDSFIKKIFDDKSDELVHLQFQKFSRGEFKNKAVLNLNISKAGLSISTTPEYANDLVRMLSEKLGDKKTKVTGVLVSTRDLTGILDFVDKKQFMGIKQYIIDKEMSGKEIIELCDKFPQSFIGLSFSTPDTELKIKPKAPKSAKPSTKSDEKPKADFCKVKTIDKNLVRNFIFDSEVNLETNKKIEIVHDFIIEDIILPKDEKDFAKMREMAKRKGKIVRRLSIDGKAIKKEKNFMA